MVNQRREQIKELIKEYISQHPDATLQEIGNYLGVSKQRAQVLLHREGISTYRQRKRKVLQILSASEIQVLHYVSKGKTNKEIAEATGLKYKSVKNKITGIISKLSANNRHHAVELAREKGFVI